MATATFRMRFFTLFRPVFAFTPGFARFRKPADTTRRRLVITERMVWHPAMGFRPVTEYHWELLDGEPAADDRSSR